MATEDSFEGSLATLMILTRDEQIIRKRSNCRVIFGMLKYMHRANKGQAQPSLTI